MLLEQGKHVLRGAEGDGRGAAEADELELPDFVDASPKMFHEFL